MKVSIILPTYNNEKDVENCIKSVFSQDYKNYELLVVDGGSTDKTLEIARKYKIKIIHNPHRVEEKAKVIGIKEAKGEIICFVDRDNILLDKDWITKMVKPFEDPEIIASDTYYFNFRKEDSLVTRYCALIGGDDPLAIYLGLYDRYNYFKNNWTDLPHKQEKKEGYLKIKLDKNNVPAMGSNGFLFRKKALIDVKHDPFIHSDIVYRLADKGYFAKVDIGIAHIQGTVKDFFKRKIRRIKRRLTGEIKLEHNYGVKKSKLIYVGVRTLLIFPVLYDTIKGFIRKPTLAWLFHPIATYGVILLYLYYFSVGRLFSN